MIDPGIKGTVAVVTGANSGIGAAAAEALAEQGVAVVLHYLGSPAQTSDDVEIHHTVHGSESALELVTRIKERGGRAFPVACDLMHPEAVTRLFDAAEELGPVQILVNNAAHCEMPDDILRVTAGSIDRHFAVNTRAPVLLMGEFSRRLSACDDLYGSIVNISTDAARAFATQVAYGASKAALEAFTRSAAIELGPLGIRVNALAPGPVQTGWMSADLEEAVAPSIPLRRVGSPRDIADAVVFLASEQSNWITGQVIQVAGGHAL